MNNSVKLFLILTSGSGGSCLKIFLNYSSGSPFVREWNHLCNFGRRHHEERFCKRERSGSVVECLTRDREVAGFEPHRRHCVVVLEQDTFILA